MKKEIINNFLELNPDLEEKDLLWRADGRLEWICEHGVGHTVYELKDWGYIHGCDGCCQDVKRYKKD